MSVNKFSGLLIPCALWITVLANVPAAWAHASLLKTYPENQAALEQSPKNIELSFNEPVRLVSIRLINGSGQAAEGLRTDSVETDEFRIPLETELDSGQYLVSYKVLSADAHPVSGSFGFSVAEAYSKARTVLATNDAGSYWRMTFIVNRILHSVALLLAVGCGLFIVLVAGIDRLDSALRTFGLISSWFAFATGILAIGLGGAQVLGGGLSTLFFGRAWLLGGSTTIGVSVLLSAIGLILLTVAYRTYAKRLAFTLFLAGAFLAGISRAMTGHGASVAPAWLVTPSVVVHFITAAFWFGSLWPLLRILRNEGARESADVLITFSKRAVIMVAALLAAGLVLAVIQLNNFSELVHSRYGQLLSFKLAGVGLLLLLALVNKQILTPAVTRGIQTALTRLNRMIRIEILVMVYVVTLGLVIASTSPPAHENVTEESQVPPVDQRVGKGEVVRQVLVEGNYKLELIVTETGPAQRVLELSILDGSHTPLDVLGVGAQWSLPAAGIEPLEAKGKRIGVGKYRVVAANIVVPGQWLLKFDVLVNDFEEVDFKTHVLIEKDGS